MDEPLLKLYNKILDRAREFGYIEEKNALFRDCITEKSKDSISIRIPKPDEANFWFGFIREDQGKTGAYDGLSFVIFPEEKGEHCLVSIGIGSSSLGKDGDLASNPGFRRSFMRLIKKRILLKFCSRNSMQKQHTLILFTVYDPLLMEQP